MLVGEFFDQLIQPGQAMLLYCFKGQLGARNLGFAHQPGIKCEVLAQTLFNQLTAVW